MNSYPTVRGFTAIGTGGNDFVQAMVVAVESVLQMPIPEVSMCFPTIRALVDLTPLWVALILCDLFKTLIPDKV